MKAPAGRFDVGVVGYGPVGQLTAALLGRAGHRVVVFERWPSLFPYPKAGHLDDEAIRILQSVGAAEGVVAGSWPMTGYDLLDREGEVLVALDWNHEGRSGWHSDYSAYQPNLEAVLNRIVEAQPSVAVHQGWEAFAVRQDGERAEIDARRDGKTLTAECRYVVGADGAGSVVRESAGITRSDYGFEADFLVVHVLPHNSDMEIDMPPAAQICDPARPVSIFRRHGNHNPRWEFMLLPGETAAAMETPEVCWRLVAPWGVSPANADLFHCKVYRFNSLVADRWRAGRAMLAGDVAHRMRTSWGRACAPV